MITGLAATVAAVIGLGVASAGPAAAADDTGIGSWVTYGSKNPITSSTSTWKCGPTAPIAGSVIAQACAIRSAGGSSVQAAVIVRNNGASAYNAFSYVDLYSDLTGTKLYGWECDSTNLVAGGWSVCFGNTWSDWPYPVFVLYAEVNGVALDESPVV